MACQAVSASMVGRSEAAIPLSANYGHSSFAPISVDSERKGNAILSFALSTAVIRLSASSSSNCFAPRTGVVERLATTGERAFLDRPIKGATL